MGIVYRKALRFKSKYPGTVAWRIKSHSRVIEQHLNPDEEVKYVFVGQRNNQFYDIITTGIFVITNKRIMVASKRVLFGYLFFSITPDMFNDLTVYRGIIFGKITLDTIKELVVFTNLDKNSLPEIQNAISMNIMEQKKEYAIIQRSNNK